MSRSTPRDPRHLLLFLALAGLVASCGGDRDTPALDGGTASAPESALALATSLDLRNARMPRKGLLTSGQPTPEQLEALVDAGYTWIISLRPVAEDGAGWEEDQAGEGGYVFHRIPIGGAEDLTRANVERFAELLDQAGDTPTLAYCASSNRVGALMALKARWLEGRDADEALEAGRAAGLTGLEPAVQELVQGAPAGGDT